MASNSFENFYTLSPTRTPPNSSAATASQMNLSTLTDYDQLIARSRSTGFLSKIEQDILRASSPINFDPENIEEVVVNGHKGILVNKSEINEWKGHIPISDYRINEDTNPDVIVKRSTQPIVYKQDMAIRYLRPPTPPPPGDIYIREEPVQLPAAPPLIIRQQPPRPDTPPPLVIREAPPQPPPNYPRKIIYVQGKKIPPPPRKVIIERLPSLPSKPQSIIIERWLPYKPLKRKVIFQRASINDPVLVKSKNLVVQWENPSVTVTKEFKDLGIVRANPNDYSEKYGSTLKRSIELPTFVRDIRPPAGMILAGEFNGSALPYELEGDLAALNLVDLESEGLNEYKSLLRELNSNSNKKFLQENVQRREEHASQSSLVSSARQKNFIYDLFSLIDHNSSISLEEAESLLLGLYTRLGMKYGKNEANHFFKQIEFNENGTIDLYRFRKILEKEFL